MPGSTIARCVCMFVQSILNSAARVTKRFDSQLFLKPTYVVHDRVRFEARRYSDQTTEPYRILGTARSGILR